MHRSIEEDVQISIDLVSQFIFFLIVADEKISLHENLAGLLTKGRQFILIAISQFLHLVRLRPRRNKALCA